MALPNRKKLILELANKIAMSSAGLDREIIPTETDEETEETDTIENEEEELKPIVINGVLRPQT